MPWSGALDCPVHHRTVSGALGSSTPNSPPSVIWGGRSAIIHWTVRCSTGQCLVAHRTVRCASRATTTSRQWSSAEDIKCATVRACARRSQSRCQKAHRTVYRTCPVHHRTVRCPRRQKLQRSESNGQVTWQAHRTVSGGAPDCPVRHATATFTKRLVWWLGL